LLRQKKHALPPNKKTSARTAGLVGTVQFQTLLTVNINMAPVLSVPTIIYGAANLQVTSSQVVGPARKFFIQLASAMIQGTSRKQAQVESS
jgi:hypothetical protein